MNEQCRLRLIAPGESIAACPNVVSSHFLQKLASLNGGKADRRALNWLRRPEDEFANFVGRGNAVALTAAAKRDVAEIKKRSGSAITRLLEEQLRLEEGVATLVEDVYELTAEGRKLLRATRPIRDPLDVIKGGLRGPDGVLDAGAGRDVPGE